MKKKFNRVFLIVMDSLGIGAMDDAEKFNDQGSNTFVHISQECGGLNIPTLNSLGIADLGDILGTNKVDHPQSYVFTSKEASNGKDTMTGHWEMMGVLTTKPFKTFTDTGFPKELMDELSEKTGHKLIGNYAASGTEIIKELGEEQKRDNSLIVYTSADSVLQIAAHEETTGVKELYRCCDIAREICLRPEYLLGRIIARPFIGDNKDNFKRTPNRHDLALSPSSYTYMETLKDANYTVSCIGKIYDIFNGVGCTRTEKTVSNIDGMNKTITQAKNEDYQGLCFVNLVEFDSEFGHRRDPLGYGRCIEEFDEKLKELIEVLKDDDLLILTADHGNDPTHTGTDHTRERVPVVIYSKELSKGRLLKERDSFADLGATIIDNFGLSKKDVQIGSSFLEELE